MSTAVVLDKNVVELPEPMYRACMPEQRDDLADQATEFIELGFVLPWELGSESSD